MRFPTPFTWILLAAGLEMGSLVPLAAAAVLELLVSLPTGREGP